MHVPACAFVHACVYESVCGRRRGGCGFQTSLILFPLSIQQCKLSKVCKPEGSERANDPKNVCRASLDQISAKDLAKKIIPVIQCKEEIMWLKSRYWSY